MNISLIGMMGAGKTTVGKLLSESFGIYAFVDTDKMIVQQEGITINEIFEKYGESYFRKIETDILKNTLNNDNQIISTGGGIIKSDINLSLLKEKSKVVYLKASADILYERVKNNKERPLLNCDEVREKIINLLNERSCRYELAHYIIETDNKTPQMVVKEITEKINDYC
ncbi:shikimate kinase [bacterium]|nr:shikimate kinase [bacterium]